MLFTRSIRRKMVFLLGLVGVMLLASSAAGLASLRWYYNEIQELDFGINKMPRHAELDAAIGGLVEPLCYDPAEVSASVQYDKFITRVGEAEKKVAAFREGLAGLPDIDPNVGQRQIAYPKLDRISAALAGLKREAAPLADPGLPAEVRQVVVARLKIGTSEALGHVWFVPDPQQGLARTIRNAVEGYDTRFGWIVGSGSVAFILFLCIIRYGYCGIFAPLRQLHRGARRVAQGDFDYRVKLKRVTTDDEIHELADAFNRMTDRFQEITGDLDRQVQERSQQLVRSERLAGIGFLSAGVAHEINNPLSAIAMAAESLDTRSDELFATLAEGDRKLVKKYLTMIQRESFRCQQITRRLLDFARGQGEARVRFDLTGTIIEVLEMVGHMGKYSNRNITLRHVGPVHLEGNGPEIKQVVLNLVANSLDAMEDGGTLDIAITELTDEVVVTFKDDGCGMTPEVIEHLFEPFFTKRKSGKGTGLGLSISHRIIADHGGTIEASSEGCGKGSTFRIRLPRKPAAVAAA